MFPSQEITMETVVLKYMLEKGAYINLCIIAGLQETVNDNIF